jgi:4-hydroxybenzoate polyprenyltransferase
MALPPHLVIDLDGTLTLSDTLLESIIKLIRARPLSVFLIPFWLVLGRAEFKSRVASRVNLNVHLLPYNIELINYIKEQKYKFNDKNNQGRKIILATAAHESIAQAVQNHLKLFDNIISSNSKINMKGHEKLKAIIEMVGHEFTYAGNSAADMPIWRASSSAILVATSNSITARARKIVSIEKIFSAPSASIKKWMQAIRIHQWLKNTLIFIPFFTAFAFSLENFSNLLISFVAFSLIASSSYIVNDILDLENDRSHPRKRMRLFASGEGGVIQGLFCAVVLLLLGLTFSALVSNKFLLVMLVYIILTNLYSWWLKAHTLVDVLVLSMLYTLRIIAGAVAINVIVSFHLLAFSVFIFSSLALVKRSTELMSLRAEGKSTSLSGRDYTLADQSVIWPLGVSFAVAAIIIFGFFINLQETRSHYESPDILWLCAIGLSYWIGRIWIKTARNDMHDDPVMFTIKDKVSQITIGGTVLVMLISHFFKIL